MKLDDVSRRIKSILDKHRNLKLRRKSSHDQSEKSSNSFQIESEITEKLDKVFLLTIATFNVTASDPISYSMSTEYILKNMRSLQLFVCTQIKGQPDFIVKNKKDQIGFSLKRIMSGLSTTYKEKCEAQANALYNMTIVRKLPTYLKRMAGSYPQSRQLIMDSAVKAIPHKDRTEIVLHLVYSKFVSKLGQMMTHFGP